MNLSALLSGAGIVCPEAYSDIEVTDIVTNSKKVTRGSMYICMRGGNADGHGYVPDAEARGVGVIVAEKGVETRLPVIYVKDSRRAMAHLYSAFYDHPQNDMKIVGVTGTNGKTTTSRMIYEILRASGRRAGLIGTIGCELDGARIDIRSDDELANLTTPDPCELYKIFSVMRDNGAEYVIMEVSSHALALSKVSPVRFEMGIFTNMTPEHLDFHGDMENYFEAKASLFEQCKKGIVNCDDAYGRLLSRLYRDRVITCGIRSNDYAVGAEEIEVSASGVEYKLTHPTLRMRVACAIPGEFTVMNSLEALVCAYELGVSAKDIKNAFLSLGVISGRLERVQLDGQVDFSVFIDYAHTPDALKNLLRSARGFARPRSRIVLLFGCGGDRDRYKRSTMGRIASAMADFVIITSDNSRSEKPADIIAEILRGVDKESAFTVIEDRESAIEYAVKNARSGDIILLSGKGHENYEIDREGKRYFCERELVEKYTRMYHLS